MPRLFGCEFSRRELMRRIGDISQVGGVKRYELIDGNEKGVEAVDFRTGTGFSFTVLPGRGMDISYAEYRGLPLCWRSATGDVASSFFEPEGLGWLRSFFGGLLTTCGLTYLGEPCRDEGLELGLHGRASNIPARHVCVSGQWEGEEYMMVAQGVIREAAVFGENISLTRRISTSLGENRLFIEDVVENLGFERTPHMILYHINAGYPVVDEGSELLCPVRSYKPRDKEAEIEQEQYNLFLPPVPGFKERVYYLNLKADKEGYTYAGIVNRRFDDGEGFGFYVRYRRDQLPWLVEWKMNGEGCYVVGIEPANCWVEGRAKLRETGQLPFLEPGETREYELEIGLLTTKEEVEEFERRVADIKVT